jgi:GH15 family glucan-1,4-alpha-glucosidase
MKRHTYDFGVIGNCAFTAHIHIDTSVEWMCWPRFDSSFIFGNLIAGKKGGEFSIKPASKDFSAEQYYVENTNVLKTKITAQDGVYEVTDFAPRFMQAERYYKPLMLIRKIERIEGNPIINVTCKPRGEYGKIVPEHSLGSNHIRFNGLESQARLTSNISLNYIIDEQSFVTHRNG